MDPIEPRIPFRDGSLSALLTPAAEPIALCLVAHGAGGDLRSPFLGGVASGLARGGVSALRFNFPYTEAGRRGPDRAPVLLEAWRSALETAAGLAVGVPLVASGTSLGGRMASQLAAEDGTEFAADALVFFGYPLHAPGKHDQPRDEHFVGVTVPMLFIQGTADPLATFWMIEALVERLAPLARLHRVDGGDHSFRVRGARRPDEEIGQELGGVAARFVAEVVA
jgi:predicted alpha/beta-hydrolase family hydrolase